MLGFTFGSQGLDCEFSVKTLQANFFCKEVFLSCCKERTGNNLYNYHLNVNNLTLILKFASD